MKKLIKPSHRYIIEDNSYIKKYKRIAIVIGVIILSIIIINLMGHFASPNHDNNQNDPNPYTPQEQPIQPEQSSSQLYSVVHLVDGDTLDIKYNDTTERIRLIGVDTPETVDSRKTVECFGREASEYLKSKLEGKLVSIESDPTQSDRDKYNRLLRYVYLDGEDVGLSIIANGYGHEYTYNIPYMKQSEYKAAQSKASEQNLGLWSPSTCNGDSTRAASASDNTVPVPPSGTSTPNSTECLIKGNINNKGVKIYHVPGQQYYNETVITPSKGERYFCTEQEAIDAGWRKSKV